VGVQAGVQSGDEVKHWHSLGPCPCPALLCYDIQAQLVNCCELTIVSETAGEV
jgi:hypothetical protein